MADSKLDIELKKLLGQILEDVKGVQKEVRTLKQSSPDMTMVEGALGVVSTYMEEMTNCLDGIIEWQNYINKRLDNIEKLVSGGRQHLRPAAENLQQATEEQKKSIVRKTPQESSAILKASHKAVQDFLKPRYDK